MRIRRNSSVLHALRWDLLIAVVILGVWWFFSAFEEPTLRPATSPESYGSRPPDRAEGDILLLLPDTPSAAANSIDELDCSYAWFNALWREFGSFSTAMTRDLSPEVLAGRQVVILPARVVRSMPPAGVQLLSDFANEGGQVVLEMPNENWSLISGVLSDKKVSRAQQITSVDGLNVHGTLRNELTGIPLRGNLIQAPPLEPYPTGPVLIEVDSQPGWLQLPTGKGQVHTFLFNVGCSLTALQQGTPAKDMSFVPGDEPIKSSQRANSALLKARSPMADLLVRSIFERLRQFRPIPRLWLFPGASSGAMMMTHSASRDPRAAFAFAESAKNAGGTATIFAASDRFTKVHAELAEKLNVEVGLHWIQGFSRPPVVDPVGLGALRPIEEELNIDQQFMRLNLNLPAERALRVVRLEDMRVQNNWAGTFKQLAASRVRLDSSFGPTEPDQWGYIFGSGFPYYPLDETGLPLPLLEQPFVLHSDNMSQTRLKTLLKDSQALYHQPIVISLPSNAMRSNPSAGILMAFDQAFELAQKHDHWVTNLGEFMDFLSTRRRSILTSRWSAEERTLTVTLNLVGTTSSTLEKGAFAGLAVPRTFEDQEIVSVFVDEKEVSLKDVATNGANTDRIISVPGGRHTIDVIYAEPLPPTVEP